MTVSTSTTEAALDLGTAEKLAAVVVASHRRSLDERVVLDLQLGDRAGTEIVDVPGTSTFAVLRERLRTAGTVTGDASEPSVRVVLPGAVVPFAGPVVELLPEGVRVHPGDPAAGWDAAEADLFADLVGRVLAAGRAQADVPVTRLRLTRPDEPAFWGDPDAPVPVERLEKLIARHAVDRPDAPAVSCGDVRISYRELDERANAGAEVLRRHGVRPDDVVGLFGERSAERVVALLAILKAGAAYLALNPDDPASRLAMQLRDAGARLVAAEPAFVDAVPEDVATLPLDELAPVEGTATAPLFAAGPDHLAYVCYTSGSTGVPKGVGVPHRAVARLVCGPNWVDPRPDDVFLQLSPLSFDAATVEIFSALVNGGHLAVLPPGRVEPDRLEETVRREGVTVLLLPTGLLHYTIEARPGLFTGVRHVLTGGDVASASLVRQLFSHHPGMLFTNGYGPTENTSYTTCWTSRTPPATANVSIGDPVSGSSVAVLDEGLHPVPAGVCGELYAAGDGLARGYLSRPGATADRFMPHPDVPGARMYRTGDLARRAADGTVVFVGRADDQVKVNGYRVEPGEIEDALLRQPEVAQAAVTVQRDENGTATLIAYAVPAAEATPELGARLRERLRDSLPAYMIPTAVLVRPGLAITPNGKLDRNALPAVHRHPRNVWNDYVPPSSPTEMQLAEMWGELIGVEPVGVEDDFFELGGHSLLAAELMAKVSRDMRVEVSARTLYLQPTVAEMAAAIEEAIADGRTNEVSG
ncbi:amino acid adenylation domain-containing protein [Micromonospora sp. M71_S20]|uniref:non-ribosomal peptide synthetase n=1 Tax=Micromonospora sp. M71_S20 TaxID=592872 RepID=UPI000F15BCCA|nr:non-ribosomal peptide synthetase [Micromonospora sp. M71_S20]RLK24880.1 amino acid adenylation domain-containing protein [Micromonospora sp. M71_S20]